MVDFAKTNLMITFAIALQAQVGKEKNCDEDISWGEWSAWSNCSAVCKENGTTENPKGTQTRSRKCNNASCVGDETETRKCTIYCRVCKDKIGTWKCNQKKKDCKRNWGLRNIDCQKTCGTCNNCIGTFCPSQI